MILGVIRLQREGNVNRFRFSIRTLLMVSAVIAIPFPFRDAYETWRRDRLAEANYTYLDCENLCAISEGDSVESVTRIFPSLIEVEPTPLLQQNLRLPKFGTKDQIYRYSFAQYSSFHSDGYGFFHFREGRLASHPDAFYSDPAAMTLARGGKLPTAFERMAVFPVYLAAVILIFTIYFLFRQLVQMFRGSSNASLNSKPDECTNVG